MGPIIMGRVAVQERLYLRSQGHGFFAINRMMDNFDSHAMAAAVAEADVHKPGLAAAFYKVASIEQPAAEVIEDADPSKPPKTKAFGDGTILKRLQEAFSKFADSEFGKILLEALKKILIGFLVV